MAVLDRFFQDILREEGKFLILKQGFEISRRTNSRTGNLLSGRFVAVTDNKLTLTHPVYERFLDMKSSGRKRRKIHNRFTYGAYAMVADKLMNGIRERILENLNQSNQ